MSSKFESSVREIKSPQQKVYDALSNLQNLEKIRDRLPEDKIQDFTFDNDSVSVNVPPVGSIALQIIDQRDGGETVAGRFGKNG